MILHDPGLHHYRRGEADSLPAHPLHGGHFWRKALLAGGAENAAVETDGQGDQGETGRGGTEKAQYVWQKYPELTTKKDYPITTPGNLARIARITEERQRTLRDNREDFALLSFQRPDCSYCDEQSRILEWFTTETGWTVKQVNIQENPGLAAKFNVDITPTLILIQKGNQEYLPVSAGVISADEIEDKAYRAVRLLKGEITPEEYSLYEFQKGGGFDVKKRRLQEQEQKP